MLRSGVFFYSIHLHTPLSPKSDLSPGVARVSDAHTRHARRRTAVQRRVAIPRAARTRPHATPITISSSSTPPIPSSPLPHSSNHHPHARRPPTRAISSPLHTPLSSPHKHTTHIQHHIDNPHAHNTRPSSSSSSSHDRAHTQSSTAQQQRHTKHHPAIVRRAIKPFARRCARGAHHRTQPPSPPIVDHSTPLMTLVSPSNPHVAVRCCDPPAPHTAAALRNHRCAAARPCVR